jgi:glycosyltransferase involved in cell wall biosynthesis
MKITITTPAKFPAAFAAARYHERRGELVRIVSPVPRPRSRRLGVSDQHSSGIAALGAWNYAAQRLAPRSWQQTHQLAFSAAFDEAASRMIGDCDVVNAWCTTALRTIRAAHRRGILAVLEVASAHIEAQEEILREEFARYGSDVDRAVITPGVVQRTLQEYDEADRIVVTSSFVRRTLVARGVDASKIAVVPYGIDATSAAARTLRRPGSTVRPLRVLFVGGCSLRKGIPYLVEAFRRIETPGTLRLVGRTNEALFRRIGGLPANVEAVGQRSGADLAAEYAAADVFALPSVEDGWGLVTNEAMSAGLPVVVSDHAGSAEIVREGVNGFVVPARDVNALAQRLDTLLAGADLRVRMGTAARATAEARTWETYGDERRNLVYEPLMAATGKQAARAAAA